jgi:hypothetical protein
MREEATVFLAVARVVISIHGARSLKDRRRVLRSLRDRVRQRFAVSCNELAGNTPSRGALVVTTGGGDQQVVGQTLDRVRALVMSEPRCVVTSFQREVMAWSGTDSSMDAWLQEFDV